MLQKILIAAFLLLITGSVLAQENIIDQQKIETWRKQPDSNYVNYLETVALVYSKTATKNDSAEILLTEAIAVAEKINYTEGLLNLREDLGQLYYQKGKLSPALNLLLKNDALSIQNADTIEMFSNLRLIIMVYLKIGDINMGRAALNRRQFIIDHNGIKGLKDTSYQVLSQYNSWGSFYALPKVNKLDSAGIYYRKIYQLGTNTASHNLWAQLGNGGLGRYYAFEKMYDSAIYHYKNAMAAALEFNRFDNYYGFMVALADVYRQSGQLDSAYLYAYKAYNDASRFSYIGLVGSSSGLLANLFKDQHRYDSAVKYMALESRYKDSVSGQETLKNIQMLTSDQQFKELEKQREKEAAVKEYKSKLRNYFFIGGLALLLLIIMIMYRVNKQRSQSKREIEAAYNNLKATQAQLVQSEKMASLGELTAGIAHEIQNPLNFVNNFSEVNNELIEELKAERQKAEGVRDMAIENELINDIKDNSEKINHHGKRADAIVKGMLQHSRSSSGQKEPTDINKLADEYLRLAYHGLRAKDKSFNATLKTDYDETIGNVNVVPQDIGRVVLNLITNAFYAVGEKNKQVADKISGDKYEPTVTVSTRKTGDKVQLMVTDNGAGIPQHIVDKIFQPFFTTKPTGQGTGLGLSLAYDIVKAHGGELKVETKENEGTTFIIQLPV